MSEEEPITIEAALAKAKTYEELHREAQDNAMRYAGEVEKLQQELAKGVRLLLNCARRRTEIDKALMNFMEAAVLDPKMGGGTRMQGWRHDKLLAAYEHALKLKETK